jgi:hypothetical protein
MKCKQAQQRLLATSGPRKVPAEVQVHVEQCARCRRWQLRLAEIDRMTPQLLLPSSGEAKAALLEQILASEPVMPRPARAGRIPGTAWQRALLGLAAGVLLVLGVAVYRGGRPPEASGTPSDPLLASLLKHNLDLAKDPTPEKTMTTLAAVARDLDDQTRRLARVAGSEDLRSLAALYDDVVRKGMLVHADEVPEENKQVLKDIAEQLFATSREAGQLAKEVPPGAAVPLRAIADAARDGNTALRQKAKDSKLSRMSPSGAREGKS